MSDREALLAACFANPCDDLARLVFADYLEEQGDADWARLIRVQIARSNRTSGQNFISAEESKLIERFWSRLPRSPYCDIAYHPERGFLNCDSEFIDSFPRESWPEPLLDLFRTGRVESVTIGHPISCETLPARTAEFLRMVGEVKLTRSACESAGQMLPLVRKLAPGEVGTRLQRITVPDEFAADLARYLADDTLAPAEMRSDFVDITDPLARTFARQVESRAFRGVRSIRIWDRVTLEVAARIAGCPDLSAATLISFERVHLTAATAEATAGGFAGAKTVSFAGVTWGPGAAAAWLALPWLQRLENLSVSGEPIGPEGIEALVSSPFPRLHTLQLGQSGIELDAVRSLATAPAFSSLSSLLVEGCSATAVEQLAFRLDPATRHIALVNLGQEFNLSESDMGLIFSLSPAETAEVWPPAAANRDWSSIAGVRLEGCEVTPEWFTTLAACFARGLTALEVCDSQLRLVHAKALAATLPTLRPKQLDLGCNKLGAAAIQTLLKNGGLASVETLDLSDNPIPNSGLALLTAANLPSLQRLSLSGVEAMQSPLVQEHIRKQLPGVEVSWT